MIINVIDYDFLIIDVNFNGVVLRDEDCGGVGNHHRCDDGGDGDDDGGGYQLGNRGNF